MPLTRRLIKLPDGQGVQAGQTAIFSIPPTGTYFKMQLRYKQGAVGGPTQAQVETDLTEMRIKLDGKVMRTFSARELIDMMAFVGVTMDYGAAAADFAYLDLHLAEPWRPTIPGEDGFAWGMSGMETFTLEVDIAAAANAPELALYAQWTPVFSRINLINQWHRFTLNPGAAGEVDFVPPKIGSLFGFHLDMAVVTISAAKIKADQAVLFDATKGVVDRDYKARGYVPQADWFHVVPDKLTGRSSETILFKDAQGNKLIQDFRIIPTVAGAGAIPVIGEFLAHPFA